MNSSKTTRYDLKSDLSDLANPISPAYWEQLNSEMLHELSPYFSNIDELYTTISCKTHLWEYSIYKSIKNTKDKKDLFDSIFKIVHSAKKTNSYLFTKTLRETWIDIREALKNYFDLFYLERKKMIPQIDCQ